jgi:hypothetical protein
MSDSESRSDQPPLSNEPIVARRGLSDRSLELLHRTQRTDEAALPADAQPYRVIRSLWWPLLYFVLALSIVDFLIVPFVIFGGSTRLTQPLFVICWGLAGSQIYLIALGIVFGKDSLTSRLGVACLLMLFMFCCVTAGYFCSVSTVMDEQLWSRLGGTRWFAWAGLAWCMMVAMLLGFLLPLSIARGWLGWRLTNADEMRNNRGRAPEPTNRYSLRDLLMVTTIVGLTFAVPRFTYDPRSSRLYGEFLWIMLAAIVVAAAVSSLILSFLLWKLFRDLEKKAPDWAWLTISILLWALVIPSAILLALPMDEPPGAVIASCSAIQSVVAGALVGLLVVRAHGWRIESARQPLVLS